VPGADTSYPVRLDPVRTRYVDMDLLDPAWVRHYYAWERPAGDLDRLVKRAGVAPLPFRGRLTLDHGYREYRVAPATEELRGALVDFLVAEFQAVRVAPVEGAYAHEVRIGEATVYLGYRAEDRHLGVWMDRDTDTRLVATIAERFDAALRTGVYDHLFSSTP